MVRKQYATEIGLLAIGLAFTVLGIVMAQLWAKLIEDRFYQELAIKPGSQSFEKWRLTPLPVILKIYFWNWTNPDQIRKEDYVPSFVEMGPYVFKEIHEKVNITWNENGTVTYQTVKRWYFDPDKTNGSLSDNVTSVNVVAASASYITRNWNRFFLFSLSMALKTTGQEIAWTRNVSQLLFEGFENSIQTIGSYVPGFQGTDKFGWYYGRNNTSGDNYFTMDTGVNGIKNIGALYSWNFQNQSQIYPSCKEITGFTGEFWPPNRTKEEPLDMYTTDMCRLVKYYYEEESIYDGLPTYVYAGTEKTVDNGTLVEENKCYCGVDGCLPSGVFDVSSCQQGAPVFISYPHFYNADSYYTRIINGMNPDRDKHRFYIELEPRTGIQLDVAARMQINVYLKNSPSLSMFKDIPDMYIPVFWLETRVMLSEEFTEGLKLMFQLIPLGPFIWYGISSVGLTIIAGIIIYHLHNQPFDCVILKKRNTINTSFEEVSLHKKKKVQKIGKDQDNTKESVKFFPAKDKTVIND